MDRRERLVFQINKLANAITLQKLVVVETLMRELQGGNSGEVQLMIEEFLKKIAPSKLAATGESFYVAADENSLRQPKPPPPAVVIKKKVPPVYLVLLT